MFQLVHINSNNLMFIVKILIFTCFKRNLYSLIANLICPVPSAVHFTLKMEAARVSEMLVHYTVPQSRML